MIWLILVTVVTYSRSLFNDFISDDVTENNILKKDGYPIRWKEAKFSYNLIISDIIWKVCKENTVLHHLVNITLFSSLVCSIYFVGQKYLPQNVAFVASLLFAVHPCNAQVGGWVSGKWYGVNAIIGLWALYFNNIVLYLITGIFACNMLPLPLFMNLSIPMKVLSLAMGFLILFRMLESKAGVSANETAYKKENFQLYWAKIIVVLKSFSYYFSLCVIPLRLGWFHELGEPVNENTRRFDLHAVLGILLILTMLLFWGTKAFIGLLIFAFFIAPFTNIITLGLFTSERYMTPALIGWSIFLAYQIASYPILVAVIATLYFMRTQLELFAYRDDFSLGLYSLINFRKSGFAWVNLSTYFFRTYRPSAGYDTLLESTRQVPEFPSTYYQLYQICRTTDLLHDYNKAIGYFEKACVLGKHDNWYKELDSLKEQIRIMRANKLKENVERNRVSKQFRPTTQPATQYNRQECVGVSA